MRRRTFLHGTTAAGVGLADGSALAVENGWAPGQADLIVVPGSAPGVADTGVPECEAQGGILKNARVVDDGDLVTAGSARYFEYETRGTVWTANAR